MIEAETQTNGIMQKEKPKNNQENGDGNSSDSKDTSSTSNTSNCFTDLYKMRLESRQNLKSPAKVEFQIYKEPKKHQRYSNKSRQRISRQVKSKPKQTKNSDPIDSLENAQNNKVSDNLLTCLHNSFQINKNSIPLMDSRDEQTIKDPKNKFEIYFFDHGNEKYFHTTDFHPNIISELLAQQTTSYATRFWAEIYGTLHIGVTFFVTFLLQTYRFILYSIVRPILVGFLQMSSDYFLKPTIAIVFNGFIQPPITLFLNILTALNIALEPVAKTLENFSKPFVMLLSSFRLIGFTRRLNKRTTKTKQVRRSV